MTPNRPLPPSEANYDYALQRVKCGESTEGDAKVIKAYVDALKAQLDTYKAECLEDTKAEDD